ncbi:MAG TPA: hypothetical protein VME45_17065 [Stellaceae bacterium]|nr:hypothetical protein [Stellaceae bacterium]
MTRNVRLSWIADAEARRFLDSVSIQHGLSEPRVDVVLAEAQIRRRHWVRRLVARLTAARQPEPVAVPKVWPHGGLC